MSEGGHARFAEFPDVIADDLWVDRQFGADEKAVVDCLPARVRTPRDIPDLLSVLRRVYRGNAEQAHLSPAAAGGTADTVRGLVRSAGPSPRSTPLSTRPSPWWHGPAGPDRAHGSARV